MTDFPTHEDLFMPTIHALKALGGTGTIHEIFNKIVELEGYSDDILAVVMPDGRPKLNYRSHWARTYLKNADAVGNSARGVWYLTDFGEEADEKTIKERVAEFKRNYNLKRRLNKKLDEENLANTEADEQIDEESEDYIWQDELLEVLKSLEPSAFERLSQWVLRESGFDDVKVTGKSGDGGIDGAGILRMNLIAFQVMFQCKRYADSVGPNVVRDFRGAMQGRADKGLIITTGAFTKAAREEATRDGAPSIDLVDGDALCELLKQTELGVSVEMVEQVSINTDWFAKV